MTEAKVVKSISANADKVWEQLSDFAAVKAGGAIDAVSFEGEGVGMVRTISMGGGDIIERLETRDPTSREFSYVILNDDCPLPFRNYSAHVKITADSEDSCTVEWTGVFEAEGDEDAAVNTATGIYSGAIKGAKIALGVT